MRRSRRVARRVRQSSKRSSRRSSRRSIRRSIKRSSKKRVRRKSNKRRVSKRRGSKRKNAKKSSSRKVTKQYGGEGWQGMIGRKNWLKVKMWYGDGCFNHMIQHIHDEFKDNSPPFLNHKVSLSYTNGDENVCVAESLKHYKTWDSIEVAMNKENDTIFETSSEKSIYHCVQALTSDGANCFRIAILHDGEEVVDARYQPAPHGGAMARIY